MIAVLLIGDEILGAHVRDENAFVILSQLAEIGYPAGELRVVMDDREAISSAVRELAHKYELVICAGGIGPTHDDITVEAVATAFGVDLSVHPEMRAFLEERYSVPLSPMVAKMAELPVGTEVAGCKDRHWPVIKYKNVYLLPGLPRALRDKITRIVQMLPARTRPWKGALFLSADESAFADDLDRIQLKFPGVAVGSYPVIGSYEYRSRITVTGSDEKAVNSLWQELNDHFSRKEVIVRLETPDRIRHDPANEGREGE